LRDDPTFYGDEETNFVDSGFPPNLSALYQIPNNIENKLFTFARSESLLSQRPIEILGLADPNDIVPGMWRMPSLMSALAGVSEIRPEALGCVFED
jgi:hypothetical protein